MNQKSSLREDPNFVSWALTANTCLHVHPPAGNGLYSFLAEIPGLRSGISIDESTGISLGNKKIAEEYRSRREAELLEESIHGKRAVATFSQASLSYIEAGGETRFLEPILKHFGTMKLASIGQHELDTGARRLYPTQSNASLRRQFYAPVIAILNHASQRGWYTYRKFERPELPPPRVRWINYDQASALIDECATHLKPLVIFLLYTGARIGEALWLDWHHVDLDRKHVEFIDTKNGTSRGVPLHPRVVTALHGLSTRWGYVFTKQDSTPYRLLTDNPEDTSAGQRIATGFGNAVRRAGLTDFHPHDCRHTWATWHYQANRDLGALQKLGGWKTLAMVLRYAHTNVAELDQTIERIK